MDVFDDQFPSWEGQGVGSSMKKLHMTYFLEKYISVRPEVLSKGFFMVRDAHHERKNAQPVFAFTFNEYIEVLDKALDRFLTI